VPTLEEVLVQLATAPPSEFTRERNALVSRLTKLGQKEAAARVKAVPKPTVSVWAVNRLAREAPKNVNRLITAAEQMRAAQLGRGDLRAASASYQAALAHLSERAGAILREPGLGATHQVLLRVETTLAAAAADPDLQTALRQGRLERELAARGFEVFAGEEVPPLRPRTPVQAPTSKADAAAIEELPAPSSAKSALAERQAARLVKRGRNWPGRKRRPPGGVSDSPPLGSGSPSCGSFCNRRHASRRRRPRKRDGLRRAAQKAVRVAEGALQDERKGRA
jgi:hypothetical protein